jgi:hypothetical protein
MNARLNNVTRNAKDIDLELAVIWAKNLELRHLEIRASAPGVSNEII